jgi:hypothetical protein
MCIKRRDRLMNKLHNADTGFPRRFTESPALRSSEIDRNGEYRSREIVAGRTSASNGCVGFQVSKDFSDSIGWFDRSPVNKDGAVTPQRHLGRPDEAWRGATFCDVHVLPGFAPSNDV